MIAPSRFRVALRLYVALVVCLLVIGTIARVALIEAFGLADAATARDWVQTLWLGLRFDLRIAVVSLMPILIAAWLPWIGRWFEVRSERRQRRVIGIYWGLVSLVWVLAAVFDTGYYAYLSVRLSAYAFSLARDADSAVRMIWQSYPVLWIVLGVALSLAMMHMVFSVLWQRLVASAQEVSRPRRRIRVLAARSAIVIVCLALIHGRWSQYPLRWSDSQHIASVNMRAASLNPLQNLADTRRFSHQGHDPVRLPGDLALVRAELGLGPVTADASAPLLRCVADRRGGLLDGERPRPVNVVLIMLESFSAHKTGAFGNPLGATPNFDRLAEKGVLFTNMFAAHMGTARGVFATMTGTPDFSSESTASRNPEAVEQHLISNEFAGYDHFYFIGGSTSWANVRGFLVNGMDGLRLVEEADMSQRRADVWGVPDHQVFEVANERLSGQKRPFFAVIQTASNHKPYTIPTGVETRIPVLPASEADAQREGFADGLDELRSLQYLDWSVGRFFELAEKASYYRDTLFVLIGDHGINTMTGAHMPSLWNQWRLTQGHTPLLLFAPRSLPPERIDRWAMQVDVMPTIAGAVGIAYRNTTLGQDLLDRTRHRPHAVGYGFAEPEDRLWMSGDWVYRRDPAGTEQALPWRGEMPGGAEPRQMAHAQRVRDAWFNVARYLMTHNKRLPRNWCDDALVVQESAAAGDKGDVDVVP